EISSELLDGLDETIANLGTSEEDLDVARSIAARIAVDNGDYNSAKQYIDPIINSKRYTLASMERIHTSADESILGFEHNVTTRPNNYDLYSKGDYRHMVRYTEIILLAAEINLKLHQESQAIALLNQVRIRNGKEALANNESDVLGFLHEEVKAEL